MIMENIASPSTVLWLGFAAAFVFGAIGQKTHFCTMGAVSDIVNMEDWSRMRMWLLAIGVAILGAGLLHANGQIDLGKTIYRTPTFTWLSYQYLFTTRHEVTQNHLALSFTNFLQNDLLRSHGADSTNRQ